MLFVLLLLNGLCASPVIGGSGHDSLVDGFAQPPQSARPLTWWHWMDGNVTREGITKDLEEMKRVGLAGATLFNVTKEIPPGPVKYLSPEWHGLFKHAVAEAGRNGLELGFQNCAGWSGSGGPWVKPEQAMQTVVWSEARVRGPLKFSGRLPNPPQWLDYYRDIAVLAYPTSAAEKDTMRSAAPVVSSSSSAFNQAAVTDGDWATFTALPLPHTNRYEHIQFDFARPFTARSLMVVSGPGRNIHCGELQASDDGTNFIRVTEFVIPHVQMVQSIMDRSFPAVTARCFRLVFTKGDPGTTQITIAEVELSGGHRLVDWGRKAGFMYPGFSMASMNREVEKGFAINRAEMTNLTASLAADGRLTWDVPAGDWTILRFGHSPTGATNRPAPPEGAGLECDKLSREAVAAFWKKGIQPLLDETKPWVGKALRQVLIDSWEVGCQNWTSKFREEFQKRRGYDLTLLLPVVSGRVLESEEISERFLWDFRKTIGELLAENYFGEFQRLCRQHNLELAVEPYGNGLFDPFAAGEFADVPMGEFWVGNQVHTRGNKLAASLAHVLGKSVVGAESFTSGGDSAAWKNHPYSLKTIGDSAFCQGINRFVFHRYAHQPWLNRFPGMTMGPNGLHFERTLTWWNQSPAWLNYLSRCEYLLQQGHFSADICYALTYCPPNDTPTRGQLNPLPPSGYDYDLASAESLLPRLSVRKGQIVLPSGMSYRVLVLPDTSQLRPASLKILRNLVRSGATVFAPKPQRSPSLENYPECDREVRMLAEELWGDCDGKQATSNVVGKGKIFWGISLQEILAQALLKPDFEVVGGMKDCDVNYIHRQVGDAEIFFLANGDYRSASGVCAFRVTGRQPEFWHADTGKIENVAIFEERAGRTLIPIQFEPAESLFVVFRKSAMDNHLVGLQQKANPNIKLEMVKSGEITAAILGSGKYQFTSARGRELEFSVKDIPEPLALAGAWDVQFPPGWGAPSKSVFDPLISWTRHRDFGIRYFSGTATYRKQFVLPQSAMGGGSLVELDLGQVKYLAEVYVNGQKLATLWKPPFRVDISAGIQAGTNSLEVRVVNLWSNRLIGDQQLPEDCEWADISPHGGQGLKSWPAWLSADKPSSTGRITFSTWKHYSKDSPLIESGLLGPVKVCFGERRNFKL